MGRTPDILLVDDRRENLFALETLLKGMDCTPHSATSGDRALALTLEHDFALAIVDVQMPGMDGYELVELLRANPETSQIPVIFVSAAYADEQHLFKGYETGAVDYIVKPFEPAVLLGKVRVFLELAQYRFNLEGIIQQRTHTITETSQLLKAVAEFSTALLNLGLNGDFSHETHQALGKVARSVMAERAYTLLMKPDRSEMHICHEWHASGVVVEDGAGHSLDPSEFPWLMTQIARGQCALVSSLATQPADIRAELARLGSGSTRSYLLVPLRSGTSWRGLIGFDVNGESDTLPTAFHELLLMLGNALTGALTRHETMNALRESEHRFRNVATMNWVWEADADGHYTYSSNKIKDVLGLSPTDILGRSVLDFIAEPMRARIDDELRRQLDAGIPIIELECTKVTSSGEQRQVQTSCVAIRDKTGALKGIRGTTKDITERRAAEQSLAQFKTIFDTASFGAAIADLEGNITYCNKCFAEMHGYQQQDLQAGHVSLLIDRSSRLSWDNIIDDVIGQQGPNARELQHRRQDGSVFPALSVCTLVQDSHNEAHAIATTTIDLTERKALQDQLQQAQRMESIGRLAGGVAHDFNNMLGVILGQLDIAGIRIQRGESADSCFAEIKNAAERSVSLTRQLLAFARIQTVAPERLNLNDAVEGMLILLQRLIGENITLDWHPGKNLQPVIMDPAQFDQILVNLCINARDAISSSGRIGIETDNCVVDESRCAEHDGCRQGNFVRLSIDDNGSGMDPETLQHAFEPFFTTKGTGKGTGLGLATVYGAVRQNGGFVEMESQPGQGTRCIIYLPVDDSSDMDAPTSLSLDANLHAHGKETVLIVEDELAYLETMAEKLRHFGYQVLTANGAEAALRIAEQHEGRIDLLLTDVVMPEVDGKQLASRLTSMFPHIKCLFMSGYPSDIIADRGVLDSGIRLLHKPATSEDLACAVRDALGDTPALAKTTLVARLDGRSHPDTLSGIALPDALINDMRNAIHDGDMLLFKELIQPIKSDAPDVVAYLDRLADQYDLEQIDNYLQTMESSHEHQR
jgi:PAS domain S-box-containing protein